MLNIYVLSILFKQSTFTISWTFYCYVFLYIHSDLPESIFTGYYVKSKSKWVYSKPILNNYKRKARFHLLNAAYAVHFLYNKLSLYNMYNWYTICKCWCWWLTKPCVHCSHNPSSTERQIRSHAHCAQDVSYCYPICSFVLYL